MKYKIGFETLKNNDINKHILNKKSIYFGPTNIRSPAPSFLTVSQLVLH